MLEETTYAPVVNDVRDIEAHELGARGELRACDNLRERGWEILERNWFSPYGEIDIIARDPTDPPAQVTFLEVKTRRASSDNDVFPEEAVDFSKRMRYRNAANHYLQLHCWVETVRFDVVSLTVFPDGHARLRQSYRAFGMED